MDDFPIMPPVIAKDTPQPRRREALRYARAFVGEAMHAGRPLWRESWQRLKAVSSEDEAVEAIGGMRELLAEEDLLAPVHQPKGGGIFPS